MCIHKCIYNTSLYYVYTIYICICIYNFKYTYTFIYCMYVYVYVYIQCCLVTWLPLCARCAWFVTSEQLWKNFKSWSKHQTIYYPVPVLSLTSLSSIWFLGTHFLSVDTTPTKYGFSPIVWMTGWPQNPTFRWIYTMVLLLQLST